MMLIQSSLSDIYDLIYLILGVEMAAGVIYYYLAKLGGSKYLSNAKNVFVNVLVTILLTVLMLSIISFGEQLSKEIAKEYFNTIGVKILPVSVSNYDMIDLTLAILDQGPLKCLLSLRNSAFFFYGRIFTTNQASIEYGFLEGTSSKITIQGMMLENLINQLLYLEIIYFVLYKIFVVFKYILFPLLFPVGIAVRAFHPLRGVGAFLMALSFSFYFIFPFIYLYVLTYYPVNTNCLQVSDFKNQCELLNPEFGQEFDVLKALARSGGIFTDNSLLGTANKLINFESFIRDMVLAFCIFPFLAFAFAVMSTNILTTLLGGKMPEIGRGIVKFI